MAAEQKPPESKPQLLGSKEAEPKPNPPQPAPKPLVTAEDRKSVEFN